MPLKLKTCSCKNTEEVFDDRTIKVITKQGNIQIHSNGKFGFCKKCNQPVISKESAKKILSGYVKRKEEELGLMTGDQVKEVRTVLNMPARGLAKKLGVVSPTISRWETYKSLPSLDMDRRLKDMLVGFLEKGEVKSYFAQESIKEVLKNACHKIAV